jgi:tRNA A37 threonylcarbamoyladenosine modification protein TsaB
MYKLLLILNKEQSRLSLLKNGESLSERFWPEARDMGAQLFRAIAEILKEQDLKSEDILDFVVESELPDVYTSSRIAETVKKVYSFGVAQIQKNT